MSEYNLDRLGFDALLGAVAAGTCTPRGSALIEHLTPAQTLSELHDRQAVQVEVGRAIEGDPPLPLTEIPDVDALLARLGKEGVILEGAELWDLRQVMKGADRLAGYLDHHGKTRLSTFLDLHGATGRYDNEVARLDEALEPGGVVRDDATPELARLRVLLKRQQTRIRETAHAIARQWHREGVAQAQEPVLRDGRLVIAVRAEERSRVPGVAVDRSRTGQTVFVEPQALCEASLELKETQHEEAQEVERILAGLSAMCAGRAGDLDADLDRIAVLDAARAAARYEASGPTSMPEVAAGGPLLLVSARHPLLAASHGVAQVVPLSLELREGERTLVISGPNSGGKTVALQTVGLCAALALCGLPIPAGEGSRIPFFSSILADIGDEQSIEADLSTFTAHLKRLTAMLRTDRPDRLCLIDEAGAGTDPAQGAALAAAILERLTAVGACVLCTTHNGRVKRHAAAAEGMTNGRMVFSGESLTPTYEFVPGEPGRSYAFEIAARAGVPERLVERARALLDPREQRLDTLQAEAEETRGRLARLEQQAAVERRKAEAARERYERLAGELERDAAARREAAAREAERLVAETRSELERAIREIRERQADGEAIRRARATLEKATERARRVAPLRPPAGVPDSMKPGDPVYLIPLERPAVVESLEGKRIRVRADGLSIEMAPQDVRPMRADEMEEGIGKETLPARGGGVRIPLKEVPLRLEIIGCRAEEARERLEKYLDDALMAGLDHAAVVHGVGTGALRKMVAEVLKEHPSVAGFEIDRSVPGGQGVTLVRFRGAVA